MSYDVIVAGGGHNGLVCAADARPRRPPGRRRRAARAHRRHPRRRRLDGRSAAARPSSRSSNSSGHGLELVRPPVAHARAARGRPAAHVLRRRGPHGREPGVGVGRRRGVLPALRRSRARARSVPRRAGGGHAAAARLGRDRRLAGRPAAAPGPTGASTRARPASSRGPCRWRRPTSSASGSPPTRCAARSPPAARSLRRWGRGRPGRPRCSSPTRPETTAAHPDRPHSRAAAPAALALGARGAARASGAEMRTGAEVDRLLVRGGAVRGVALASGEEIEAPVVACGVDPKTVLTRWLDPEEAGPRLRWRAGNIRTPGATAVVEAHALGRAAHHRRRRRRPAGRPIVVAPGIDHVERAFDRWKYGTLSERPYLEATLAGGTLHVLAQWVPTLPTPTQVGDTWSSPSSSGTPPASGALVDRSARAHAGAHRARARHLRRPRVSRRARARPVLRLAAGAGPRPPPARASAASTCAAPARTRAVASPAGRAGMRPARSSPTSSADGAVRRPGRAPRRRAPRQARRVEQHDQPVADLGDPVQVALARPGLRLDLIVGHRHDLVHVVDNQAGGSAVDSTTRSRTTRRRPRRSRRQLEASDRTPGRCAREG